VVEAYLLAGIACRELGDQRVANLAAERALALAEADRLVLPFAMMGSRELLTALSRHEIAAELSVSVNTVSTYIRSI
jgi:LuxR family transcriptional regulator, maltose regulon positive regulatory protein